MAKRTLAQLTRQSAEENEEEFFQSENEDGEVEVLDGEEAQEAEQEGEEVEQLNTEVDEEESDNFGIDPNNLGGEDEEAESDDESDLDPETKLEGEDTPDEELTDEEKEIDEQSESEAEEETVQKEEASKELEETQLAVQAFISTLKDIRVKGGITARHFEVVSGLGVQEDTGLTLQSFSRDPSGMGLSLTTQSIVKKTLDTVKNGLGKAWQGLLYGILTLAGLSKAGKKDFMSLKPWVATKQFPKYLNRALGDLGIRIKKLFKGLFNREKSLLAVRKEFRTWNAKKQNEFCMEAAQDESLSLYSDYSKKEFPIQLEKAINELYNGEGSHNKILNDMNIAAKIHLAKDKIERNPDSVDIKELQQIKHEIDEVKNNNNKLLINLNEEFAPMKMAKGKVEDVNEKARAIRVLFLGDRPKSGSQVALVSPYYDVYKMTLDHEEKITAPILKQFYDNFSEDTEISNADDLSDEVYTTTTLALYSSLQLIDFRVRCGKILDATAVLNYKMTILDLGNLIKSATFKKYFNKNTSERSFSDADDVYTGDKDEGDLSKQSYQSFEYLSTVLDENKELLSHFQ